MPDFKTGDEVALRSGGPTMKVQQVGLRPATGLPALDAARSSLVTCQWHGQGRVEEDSFLPEALIRADDVLRHTTDVLTPIKVGDVVRLTSDGCKMTVYQRDIDVHGDDRIWYQWFDGLTLNAGSSLPGALKKT